jgi:hypothetical protein
MICPVLSLNVSIVGIFTCPKTHSENRARLAETGKTTAHYGRQIRQPLKATNDFPVMTLWWILRTNQ